MIVAILPRYKGKVRLLMAKGICAYQSQDPYDGWIGPTYLVTKVRNVRFGEASIDKGAFLCRPIT